MTIFGQKAFDAAVKECVNAGTDFLCSQMLPDVAVIILTQQTADDSEKRAVPNGPTSIALFGAMQAKSQGDDGVMTAAAIALFSREKAHSLGYELELKGDSRKNLACQDARLYRPGGIGN